MTRKNPTSPIRSGFSYQDLWALAYYADCIANPKAYKWIQFETVPDEIPGGYFNLDDILLGGHTSVLDSLTLLLHSGDSALRPSMQLT